MIQPEPQFRAEFFIRPAVFQQRIGGAGITLVFYIRIAFHIIQDIVGERGERSNNGPVVKGAGLNQAGIQFLDPRRKNEPPAQIPIKVKTALIVFLQGVKGRGRVYVIQAVEFFPAFDIVGEGV
jgi:hypothetical protein